MGESFCILLSGARQQGPLRAPHARRHLHHPPADNLILFRLRFDYLIILRGTQSLDHVSKLFVRIRKDLFVAEVRIATLLKGVFVDKERIKTLSEALVVEDELFVASDEVTVFMNKSPVVANPDHLLSESGDLSAQLYVFIMQRALALTNVLVQCSVNRGPGSGGGVSLSRCHLGC